MAKVHLVQIDHASDFSSKYGERTACKRFADAMWTTFDVKCNPKWDWCRDCLKARKIVLVPSPKTR